MKTSHGLVWFFIYFRGQQALEDGVENRIRHAGLPRAVVDYCSALTKFSYGFAGQRPELTGVGLPTHECNLVLRIVKLMRFHRSPIRSQGIISQAVPPVKDPACPPQRVVPQKWPCASMIAGA